MASSVGDLYASLGIDTSQFVSNLNKAERALQQTTLKMERDTKQRMSEITRAMETGADRLNTRASRLSPINDALGLKEVWTKQDAMLKRYATGIDSSLSTGGLGNLSGWGVPSSGGRGLGGGGTGGAGGGLGGGMELNKFLGGALALGGATASFRMIAGFARATRGDMDATIDAISQIPVVGGVFRAFTDMVGAISGADEKIAAAHKKQEEWAKAAEKTRREYEAFNATLQEIAGISEGARRGMAPGMANVFALEDKRAALGRATAAGLAGTSDPQKQREIIRRSLDAEVELWAEYGSKIAADNAKYEEDKRAEARKTKETKEKLFTEQRARENKMMQEQWESEQKARADYIARLKVDYEKLGKSLKAELSGLAEDVVAWQDEHSMLDARIKAGGLQAAGRDAEAQLATTEESYRRQIAQAMREGDRAKAGKLLTLFGMEARDIQGSSGGTFGQNETGRFSFVSARTGETKALRIAEDSLRRLAELIASAPGMN